MTIFTYQDNSFTSLIQQNGQFVRKTHSFHVTVDLKAKNITFTFNKDFTENYIPVTVFVEFLKHYNKNSGDTKKPGVTLSDNNLAGGNELTQHSDPLKLKNKGGKQFRYIAYFNSKMKQATEKKETIIKNYEATIHKLSQELYQGSSSSAATNKELTDSLNSLKAFHEKAGAIKINEFNAVSDIGISFPGSRKKFTLKFSRPQN